MAVFEAIINLSTLHGTTGFRLDGEAGRDGSVVSVASAGDVNGDGFDDLVIGEPGNDRLVGSLAPVKQLQPRRQQHPCIPIVRVTEQA